jgi:hypothetical protein
MTGQEKGDLFNIGDCMGKFDCILVDDQLLDIFRIY